MSSSSIQSVTVYCSSSRDVARAYFAAAAELGMAIAGEKWTLVYGGNDCGCMGALANARARCLADGDRRHAAVAR